MRFFPLTGGNDLFGQGGSGLYDTVLGILLPGMITPFGIFMFRQFFLTLPRDLEDAARIDGCTEWQIYWRVMLPLTKPAIVTLAIFTFQGSWNMFIWPLVMTRTETLRTIQIALAFFRQDQNIQWALLMAATTMATLPIILVFLVLQRYFTQGIAMTGLKG
jgi:multiple sugar transport system permease protein